jgi:purine-binding chemotaxis protein CheW
MSDEFNYDGFDDEDLSIKSGDQYFLFISGGDLFAIDALRVLEIVEYQDVVKVPKMQSCVKGVTNVRGDIMAVVDLQERLGRSAISVTPKTSMIIVKVGTLQIAVMIDEVYEVDNIEDDNIKNSPAFGTKIDRRFIKNMAKYGNDYLPILDIDSVLDVKELQVYKEE